MIAAWKDRGKTVSTVRVKELGYTGRLQNSLHVLEPGSPKIFKTMSQSKEMGV